MNKKYAFKKIKSRTFIVNREINKLGFVSEWFTVKKSGTLNEIRKILKTGRIHFLRQVHGNKTVLLSGKELKKPGKTEGDAVITSVRGAAIAVRLADCVGSVIVDPENRAVAAVHSGWRGVSNKIILRVVLKMKKEFGSAPENLIVSMSPCIQPCHFEVGREIYNSLKKQRVFSNIFSMKKGRIYMDMQKGNLNLLLKAGVKRKNVFMNDLCTMCNSVLFHSYRRDGKKAGRMMQIIQLKNDETA